MVQLSFRNIWCTQDQKANECDSTAGVSDFNVYAFRLHLYSNSLMFLFIKGKVEGISFWFSGLENGHSDLQFA